MLNGRVLASKSAELPELASTNGSVGLFALSHDSTLLTKAGFTDIKFR